jgi:hypothetical protein
MDFRQAIIEKLRFEGLSINRLANRLRLEVPKRTLYDWLSGTTPHTSTKVLEAIIRAMHLEMSVESNLIGGLKKAWDEWEQANHGVPKPRRRIPPTRIKQG